VQNGQQDTEYSNVSPAGLTVNIAYRRNRGIASYSASGSAYSYTFLHSVVCLSSVCHIVLLCECVLTFVGNKEMNNE